MICHNCEVPLDWDGISPIVACEFCRAYRFVDVPDGSGEQILSLNQQGESCCPCCRRRLTLAAIDGLKVEHCAGCEGVLLDNNVFAMFVRNRRDEFREAALQSALQVEERRLKRVNCPECRKKMQAHPSYGPNLIVIDSCVECGLVWLDCHELLSGAMELVG